MARECPFCGEPVRSLAAHLAYETGCPVTPLKPDETLQDALMTEASNVS